MKPSSFINWAGGRKLGVNELGAFNSNNHHGNLNLMCGLLLLSERPLDEGLMKCSLQEFQHMFPQPLTSRIKASYATGSPAKDGINHHNNNDAAWASFAPMECPTLPLDDSFACTDMLHQPFDVAKGPLWRVQVIDESKISQARLGFGSELSALLEDDTVQQSTKWVNFLRYQLGKLNQETIPNFDEHQEGHRCLVLMTFHPSITDLQGCFHLLRHFMSILRSRLVISSSDPSSSGGSTEGTLSNGDQRAKIPSRPQEEEQQHQLMLPLEALIQQQNVASSTTFTLKGVFQPMAATLLSVTQQYSYKSPLEQILGDTSSSNNDLCRAYTKMARGKLTMQETSLVLDKIETSDCSLHGVILAAGLLALARAMNVVFKGPRSVVVQAEEPGKSLRVSNSVNLRSYFATQAPSLGSFTTRYEEEYTFDSAIDDRADFWRLAHEMTMRHTSAKGRIDPATWFKYSSLKGLLSTKKVRNDMNVNCQGDLDRIFANRKQPAVPSSGHDKANNGQDRPEKGLDPVRLEDVFYCQAEPTTGVAFSHYVHIFDSRLNYILAYHNPRLEDQGMALTVRDEVINILRMAIEEPETQ